MSDTARNFLEEEMPEQAGAIGDDDLLLKAGLLDSLLIIQLVAYLEQHENISVQDAEVIPDNFRTIKHIRSFIKRKKQAPPAEEKPGPTVSLISG